jgi:Secretion system C-terminal sorting domain
MKKNYQIVVRFLLCFILTQGSYDLKAQFTPCLAPSNARAYNIESTSTRVLWQKGAGTITQNFLYRQVGKVTWIQVLNVTSPFTINGLSPTTSYEYAITANCNLGRATGSKISTFTTTATCTAPTNITVTNITATTAVLNWTPSPGSKGDYIFLNARALDDDNYFLKVTPPYTLKDLHPNDIYDCVLVTSCVAQPLGQEPDFRNGRGAGDANGQFTIATKPAPVGCANVNFHVKSAGSDYITLGWTNGGPNVTGYLFTQTYTTAAGVTVTITDGLLKTDLSYTVSGLQPSKIYTFKLTTRCSDGSLFERTLSASTIPQLCSISAPVSNVGDYSADIALSGNYVNPVYIEYIISGVSSSVKYATFTSLPIKLSNLIPGSNYEYLVSARCEDQRTISYYSKFKTTNVVNLPCLTPSIDFITTDFNSATVNWSYSQPISFSPLVSIDICVAPIVTAGATVPPPTCFTNLPTSQRSQVFTGLSRNYDYTATLTLKCANGSSNRYDRGFQYKNIIGSGNLVRGNSTQNLLMDKIAIIPNPSKGEISVELPEMGFEQLSITDLNGHTMKQVQMPSDLMTQKMDCADLPTGIYILSAKGGGKMIHSKFVKN